MKEFEATVRTQEYEKVCLSNFEDNLWMSKQEAIDAGWQRIHEQEARLAKQQATLDKKRAALAKAAS